MAILLTASEGRHQRGTSCWNAILLASRRSPRDGHRLARFTNSDPRHIDHLALNVINYVARAHSTVAFIIPQLRSFAWDRLHEAFTPLQLSLPEQAAAKTELAELRVVVMGA